VALFLGFALGCSDEPSSFGEPGASGAAAGTASGGTSGGGSAGTAGAAGNAGQAGGGAGGATTAGSGGAGGSGGSSGSGGASGAGGATPATPSAGCGTAASLALGEWIERPALNVEGTDRQWWVWLPSGYQPAQAYPLLFTFHGCGGPDNFVPMQEVAGDDAILVRGTGITDDGCWTYGADGDDVAFFDAMVAEVQATQCVDSSRIFVTGYSSGSWLINTLACARGDVLRAAGTVSGGVVGNRGTCSGELARIFVHDLDDTTNRYVDNGNADELERLVEQNQCAAETPPVPEPKAPCARYQGCNVGYPVVACLTEDRQHDRQDDLAPAAFWALFSEL
jgi:poly(3-hydroxybutyrate) depolymerase